MSIKKMPSAPTSEPDEPDTVASQAPPKPLLVRVREVLEDEEPLPAPRPDLFARLEGR